MPYPLNSEVHEEPESTLKPKPLLHACVLSRLSLCDSMNCSPPGSSVHGIFQARILEWVAISYSRGSFPTRNWEPTRNPSLQRLHHWQADSLPLLHLGSPLTILFGVLGGCWGEGGRLSHQPWDERSLSWDLCHFPWTQDLTPLRILYISESVWSFRLALLPTPLSSS